MASSHANLLEQKKVFTREKCSTPTEVTWYTNMAAVSMFWKTNMAAMTSCENARVVKKVDNVIYRINHYPVNSVVCFVNSYPVDSDLSNG